MLPNTSNPVPCPTSVERAPRDGWGLSAPSANARKVQRPKRLQTWTKIILLKTRFIHRYNRWHYFINPFSFIYSCSWIASLLLYSANLPALNHEMVASLCRKNPTRPPTTAPTTCLLGTKPPPHKYWIVVRQEEYNAEREGCECDWQGRLLQFPGPKLEWLWQDMMACPLAQSVCSFPAVITAVFWAGEI